MATHPRNRRLDALERHQTEKTLGSYKFDMFDALMVDHRLTPSAFKVAVALLQHMNEQTGDIFPSIDRLHRLTGLSARQVRYCLESLRDTGWISWYRGNRQRANSYGFEIDNRDVFLGVRKELLKELLKPGKRVRPATSERHSIASQSPPAVVSRGNPLPLASGNPLPPNTLREHLKKAAG